MAKWNDGGESRVANILFGSTAVDATLYMGLYSVPTSEPAESDTMSAITEPSGAGYARAALTRGTWTTGTGSQAVYAQQTFTCTGGTWGSVYGYFITTTSSGTTGPLMASEQFTAAPYTVNDGDSIKVTPTITVS
jgi:hypothetical protein